MNGMMEEKGSAELSVKLDSTTASPHKDFGFGGPGNGSSNRTQKPAARDKDWSGFGTIRTGTPQSQHHSGNQSSRDWSSRGQGGGASDRRGGCGGGVSSGMRFGSGVQSQCEGGDGFGFCQGQGGDDGMRWQAACGSKNGFKMAGGSTASPRGSSSSNCNRSSNAPQRKAGSYTNTRGGSDAGVKEGFGAGSGVSEPTSALSSKIQSPSAADGMTPVNPKSLTPFCSTPQGGRGGGGGAMADGRNKSQNSPAGAYNREEGAGSRTKQQEGAKKIWRPRHNRMISRSDELDRSVRCLLNKLTVEKFATISEKLAVLLEQYLGSREDVHIIVEVVLDKAVTEPEWSEMYADVCQILQWRSVAPTGDCESIRKTFFVMALLSKIQEEYTKLPGMLNPDEKQTSDQDESKAVIMARSKKRILGVVKLIGELFQRKLLAFKIVNNVVMDLVINSDEPDGYFVECFLQLIATLGYFIDQTPNSRSVLDLWFGRIMELQKKACYSKRIKCMIQDTIDMRKAEWRKKVHRDRATTLDEIRNQHENEQVLGGSIHVAQYGQIVVVGERKNLNGEYADYLKKEEEAYQEKIARRIAEANDAKP